ncbi:MULTISPECIES: LysR family transcriptional regulator [unclassified Mesorhizobium]|uniref:LysR family transcriptional regulator n=2 Tax=Mesorhizobium TaxID=68287 RepID=UPI0024165380|nr:MULTISPECIES: LysR family transcriptional regulator [unclassified Mesorhizobium]MDG4887860.1 LysR substrate-binding domain-containing protein [Mesorhizobium sp. WSM4887]
MPDYRPREEVRTIWRETDLAHADNPQGAGCMTGDGNALRLLAYAFAAADYGSLRRAARALRVRESSVSRNVLKLEQHLDMQLFERDFRGVRLTEAGGAWIDVARAHYDGLLDAFIQCARGYKDARTLRIGLCWVTGGEFLRRLIDRFSSRYPEVNLSIEDIPAGQCLAAIRRRQLDIAFTHDLGQMTSCCSEVFWQEPLFVLLSSRHPLVDKPAVAWSDLADMCLLISAGQEGPRLDLRLLERIAAAGGPVLQASSADLATIILKVQLGQGVTFAEESYARTITVDSAKWMPLEGHNSVSSIRAVWLDSNPKRSVLRLVGLAKNMAKRAADRKGETRMSVAAGAMRG